MGEIDTKPIESVQTAITFFGQSNEQRKNSPTNDKEVEIERLERELATVRVQMEAKEAVHNQALVKLDHYQKTANELSTLLKNSDVKKNFYINQSEEAISRVAELESALERMARQHEQLAHELRNETNVAAALAEKSANIEIEQAKEAQVEIALLKFQLHKERSKLAAAEAAVARAQSEKTALYNALQQMGLEAEETKQENRMLKEAAKSADPQQNDEAGAKQQELEDAKRELEVAISKIGELRARAEQATSRAEAAERAKAALEEQNKKRREHKERRNAALAELSREFVTKTIKDDESNNDDSAKIYQPLGKVLNMKF